MRSDVRHVLGLGRDGYYYDGLKGEYGIQSQESYLVYKEADQYKAKNGLTGRVISGRDAGTVIQQALNSLTPNRTWKEKVVLKGEYTDVLQINIPSYTIFELHGLLKAKTNLQNLLALNPGADHVEIIGGVYDGNSSTLHGAENYGVIRVDGTETDPCEDVIISKVKVKDGFSRGMTSAWAKGLKISDVEVENCNENFMFWIEPSKVATWEGVIMLDRVRSANSAGNNIDGTFSRLFFNDVRIIGEKPISIDCWREVFFNNIISDFDINLVQGNHAGAAARRAVLNNVICRRLELHNYHASEPIKEVSFNNVMAQGVALLIESGGNIERVVFDNVLFEGNPQAGVFTNRAAAATGRFDKILISNIITKDNDHRGVEIRYADYVQVKGIIAQGNPDVGVGFYNCNKVILDDYHAIKTGDVYSQGYVAEFDTIDFLVVSNVWAEAHVAGGFIFTNVADRVIRNVSGAYLFENSGTATIPAGQTSVNVPHGLAITPDINKINVTPKTDTAGKRWWVNVHPTNPETYFVINIDSGHTADITFGWSYG